MTKFTADILENKVLENHTGVLEVLISDQTTQKNILWATESYKDLGDQYQYCSEISVEAIAILHYLTIKEIRLLTNNLAKINAIDQSDIILKEKIPIEIKANPNNIDFLKTKKNKTNHFLSSNTIL